MKVEKFIQEKKANSQQAIEIFDGLEPILSDFMIGRWRGYEIKTGHPIEGLLEPSGWYGKYFKSSQEAYPLLIYTLNGKGLYAINIKLVPLNLSFPKSKLLKLFMVLLKPILKTNKPTARLRMVEYRGKLTATMIYDSKAICDHFVRIDDNTVLGAMDFKGVDQPYFFVLERDLEKYNLNF